MSYRLKFSPAAKADLERLYAFLADNDITAARRAFKAINEAWPLLEEYPFTCRKAEESNSFLRELIIPFGSAGYLALFEIENNETVTVLAVRHQREDDYH